ncbi:endonuclease/exonuclease/phosphatase family protein [Actinoplanes regularis]|uniref:Endonuclease/Exonuclease/phosphatase family protein n=1 Tax=Actinoplanes regularis TaxID=52697 RepID=A0A239FG65_9ACTN|nr:endonuclease/exonuclease/phosphatase family protein [Actinoplanes regularis]GIE89588.1 hypothetical protein Are01nite_60680 [Actinoplanes regularis]SNS55919.1 Endonuclease/Exonuclease/phosphatase family protein [Actinoplanes regularis]
MAISNRFLAAVVTAVVSVVAVVTTATAAHADIVTPTTAGPIRTISYNVCGAHCKSALGLSAWTAAMKREITAWDADAVMLQELCIGQWISLRDNLPGYKAVWSATKLEADGCDQWNKDDKRFGLGVLVKTGNPVDRLVGNLSVPSGEEPRSILCARGAVDGRTTLACSTHLAQYIRPDNGASEAMAYVGQWAGTAPVLIGADVNADSFDATVLGPFRAGAARTGKFAEVDENDQDYFSAKCLADGTRECDTGEGTRPDGRKFDDIFVTTADFHTVRGDAIEPGLSDHRLLRGAAHPEARPTN